MNITIKTIRAEVVRGNLEKSIEMLLNYVGNNSNDSKNEVYLQSSRLQRTLRNKRLGVVSNESTSLVFNQITLGILEMLDKLSEIEDGCKNETTNTGIKQLKLHLINGDVLNTQSDVLILKHAQGMYGADLYVYDEFLRDEGEVSVEKDSYKMYTVDNFHSKIVFYGVSNLWDFSYQQIASFTKDSLRSISTDFKNVTSVTYTLHGVGYGLDEYEALKFQILGLHDYLSNFGRRGSINEIYIYELDENRFLRMKEYLNNIAPLFGSSTSVNNTWTFELLNSVKEEVKTTVNKWGNWMGTVNNPNEILDDFNTQKRVLISIPFEDEFEDIYTLGILDVTRKMNFITERINVNKIDKQAISKFISLLQRCSLFIADVSTIEPIQLLQISFALYEKKKILLIYKGERSFERQLERLPKINYGTITKFKVDFDHLIKSYYMAFL